MNIMEYEFGVNIRDRICLVKAKLEYLLTVYV